MLNNTNFNFSDDDANYDENDAVWEEAENNELEGFKVDEDEEESKEEGVKKDEEEDEEGEVEGFGLEKDV